MDYISGSLIYMSHHTASSSLSITLELGKEQKRKIPSTNMSLGPTSTAYCEELRAEISTLDADAQKHATRLMSDGKTTLSISLRSRNGTRRGFCRHFVIIH